jgi:tetratricopeptide (TPR) repeat protein
MSGTRPWPVVVPATLGMVVLTVVLHAAAGPILAFASRHGWYEWRFPWDYLPSLFDLAVVAALAQLIAHVATPGWRWGLLASAVRSALALLATAYLLPWLTLNYGAGWIAPVVTKHVILLGAAALCGHFGSLLAEGEDAAPRARRLGLGLAAVFVAGVAAGCLASRPVRVDPMLEQAIVAGNWQQVLGLGSAWQRREPANLAPSVVITTASGRLEQYDTVEYQTASRLLSNAVEDRSPALRACVQWARVLTAHQPRCPAAWEMLATALGACYQYRASEQACTVAISLDPTDATAYRYRARAEWHERKEDEALSDANRAIDLAPRSAASWIYRGIVYTSRGEYDRATEDYTQAIALDPKSGAAYYYRGWSYHYDDKFDLALPDFTKAIALNPQDGYAHLERGYVYGRRGDLAAALDDDDRAIALNAHDRKAWLERGWALEHLKRPGPAREAYRQAAWLSAAQLTLWEAVRAWRYLRRVRD